MPRARRSRAISTRSESTEDHLERIQDLTERLGYARVSDIAEELRLSRSAVSNMVRRLAARGFVNYQRYRGFTLTQAGRDVAAHIKDRHHTLTAFFELMGLEPETISAEVEGIEHHLKPVTLALFASLVHYWRLNPRELRAFLRFSKGRMSRVTP